MGEIYISSCACGYGGEHLVGCGDQATCYALARCEHCRKIVTVRLFGSRLRCPRCGRKPQLIDTQGWDAPGSETHSLECPQCGGDTLKMESAGMWD